MDGNVADSYTGVNTIDNGENGGYISVIKGDGHDDIHRDENSWPPLHHWQPRARARAGKGLGILQSYERTIPR